MRKRLAELQQQRQHCWYTVSQAMDLSRVPTLGWTDGAKYNTHLTPITFLHIRTLGESPVTRLNIGMGT